MSIFMLYIQAIYRSDEIKGKKGKTTEGRHFIHLDTNMDEDGRGMENKRDNPFTFMAMLGLGVNI